MTCNVDKVVLWDEMTPRQRRVAIAQDVIDRINEGQLSIESDKAYLLWEHSKLPNAVLAKSVSKRRVNQLYKECTVCARGGMLLSRVAVFNSLSLEEMGINQSEYDYDYDGSYSINGEYTAKVLRGAFTEKHLSLIEAAFECGIHYAINAGYSHKKANEAVCFGFEHDNDEERLLAIMQNIVDHGSFRPEVKYDTFWVWGDEEVLWITRRDLEGRDFSGEPVTPENSVTA
jgi:hypothetical protein